MNNMIFYIETQQEADGGVGCKNGNDAPHAVTDIILPVKIT